MSTVSTASPVDTTIGQKTANRSQRRALITIIIAAAVALTLLLIGLSFFVKSQLVKTDIISAAIYSVYNVDTALAKGVTLNSVMEHESDYAAPGSSAYNMKIMATSCGISTPKSYTLYLNPKGSGIFYAYSSAHQTFNLVHGSTLAAINKVACY